MYSIQRVHIYTFSSCFLGHGTLDKCLLSDLGHKMKKCFITTLYRSPRQSRGEFEKNYIVLPGRYNANNNAWF